MQILHSKIIGVGEPLLILHGYFGNGDNWKTIADKVSGTFQVHLIDQRNHGRSFHSDEFDYELMIEDLCNYIEHHQLGKVNLLGHSMGGKTVMLYAVEFPENVNKLVVADISPRMYPPHHHDILDALNSIDFSVQNSRKLVDEKLSELIPEVGIRQFLMKNIYWKEKGVLDFRFNLQSLTEHNDEVGVGLPSFTIFEGETLFLKGVNSGYISSDEEPLIKAHFPNSNITTIKNAGHWLHAENPSDFLKVVKKFLS
jgi:pimeloyl-ACP methyl ester carboxylesterase